MAMKEVKRKIVDPIGVADDVATEAYAESREIILRRLVGRKWHDTAA